MNLNAYVFSKLLLKIIIIKIQQNRKNAKFFEFLKLKFLYITIFTNCCDCIFKNNLLYNTIIVISTFSLYKKKNCKFYFILSYISIKYLIFTYNFYK